MCMGLYNLLENILWRWLLCLGALLWCTLCMTDYYRKNYQDQFQDMLTLKSIDYNTHEQILLVNDEEENSKGLTIWKVFFITLTLVGLIYVKRLSMIRKQRVLNNMIKNSSEQHELGLIHSREMTLSRFIPVTNDDLPYIKSKITNFAIEKYTNSSLESEDKKLKPIENLKEIENGKPAIRAPTVDVHTVQQKLETLEKTVQSLRQKYKPYTPTCRSRSSTSTRLVSGSEEFQNFLVTNLEPFCRSRQASMTGKKRYMTHNRIKESTGR